MSTKTPSPPPPPPPLDGATQARVNALSAESNANIKELHRLQFDHEPCESFTWRYCADKLKARQATIAFEVEQLYTRAKFMAENPHITTIKEYTTICIDQAMSESYRLSEAVISLKTQLAAHRAASEACGCDQQQQQQQQQPQRTCAVFDSIRQSLTDVQERRISVWRQLAWQDSERYQQRRQEHQKQLQVWLLEKQLQEQQL